jgi:hypothetical protein
LPRVAFVIGASSLLKEKATDKTLLKIAKEIITNFIITKINQLAHQFFIIFIIHILQNITRLAF